jgi:hypothetical protein
MNLRFPDFGSFGHILFTVLPPHTLLIFGHLPPRIFLQAQSIRFVDMLSSIFDLCHLPEKMHEKVSTLLTASDWPHISISLRGKYH